MAKKKSITAAQKIKALETASKKEIASARADLAKAYKTADTQRKALKTSGAKDIKDYRKRVSKLKKAGLVSKNVDSRKAPLTAALVKKIKKYKDVVFGASVTRKAKPKTLKAAKAAGLRVERGRVVVPKAPGEKISVNERGIKTVIERNGRRHVFQDSFERPANLPEWFARERAKLQKMDAKSRAKRAYGFTVYGNQGRQFFNSLEALERHLMRYIKDMDEPDAVNHVSISSYTGKQMKQLESQAHEKLQARAIRETERRREKDRRRYQRVKGDKVKYAQYLEKQKVKYIRRVENKTKVDKETRVKFEAAARAYNERLSREKLEAELLKAQTKIAQLESLKTRSTKPRGKKKGRKG